MLLEMVLKLEPGNELEGGFSAIPDFAGAQSTACLSELPDAFDDLFKVIQPLFRRACEPARNERNVHPKCLSALDGSTRLGIPNMLRYPIEFFRREGSK